MEVKRVLLVAHPAARMYDLIEAAEYYPAFLPWCSRAIVTERSDEVVAADLLVDWHGVRFEFATRNLKRRPDWMGVRLERGPFRHFEGTWHLHPLGDDGCRIRFELHYEFDNPVLRAVAGHAFERITNTLMDAFVARADALGPAIPVPVPVGGAARAVPGLPPDAAGTGSVPASALASAPAAPPTPSPASFGAAAFPGTAPDGGRPLTQFAPGAGTLAGPSPPPPSKESPS